MKALLIALLKMALMLPVTALIIGIAVFMFCIGVIGYICKVILISFSFGSNKAEYMDQHIDALKDWIFNGPKPKG